MNESYSQISSVRRRRRNGTHHQAHSELNGSTINGHTASNGAGRNRTTPGTDRPGAHAETDKASEPRKRWEQNDPRRALPYYPPEEGLEPAFKFPFDPWRLFAAVKRNLGWVVGATAVMAIIGLIAGTFMVDYKINMGLLRKQTPDAFKLSPLDPAAPREYSDQTLFMFMKSGDLLQKVLQKAATNPILANFKATPLDLAEAIDIKPTPNPDLVHVSIDAFGRLGAMVELANIYGAEVVDHTREIQRREAAELTAFLQGKIERAKADLEAAKTALGTEFSGSVYANFDRATEANLRQLTEAQIDYARKKIELEGLEEEIRSREAQLKEQGAADTKLGQAKAELQALLLDKTEAHPEVIAKRKQISLLENATENGALSTSLPAPTTANSTLYNSLLDMKSRMPALTREIQALGTTITNISTVLQGNSDTGVQYAMKQGELESLQTTLDILVEKQRQAMLSSENAMGYFADPSPVTMDSVSYSGRWIKVAVLGFAAALAGLLVSIAMVMFTEAMDTTLKTAEDITRVTKLPVLASLGDLRKMSPTAQVNWAFRTLTLLKGKLSASPDQALVCGIISSGHGEGRSTWVNLLVSAASQRGLRVLTVDTRANAGGPTSAVPDPTPEPPNSPDANAPVAEKAGTEPETPPKPEEATNGHATESPARPKESVLSTPAKVTEQLEDPNSAVVHIPLPGWVWSLDRRKQWQKALDHWKDIDNLVIFVELPPASESESVLLAEHVPQLIWLTGSGMADAAETATQIDTLRHARCNLVGAVLNQAPPPMINAKIARWFRKTTAAIILASTVLHAGAQDQVQNQAEVEEPTREEQVSESRSFSGSVRKKRAAWQERLTFGPGDTMDISLYGNPGLTRTNLFVGPDGRISYLQAQGIRAAGLTVEELRRQLDEELAKYYTAPRTMVIPVTFSSKRYYMLGKVNGRGVYPLDRPLTVVEAVARARGLETGMYQRNTVELADLSRSFIVRSGEKLEVDFEKLFLNGDLSQNVLLEPNDYLFFGSSAASDIYVLGEVMDPGPIGFVANPTVMKAIADRGGYTEDSYKKRVLVVRGSLNQPETFAVDTGGILDARITDFELQPKDIVYVSKRPWIRIEELADEAVQSFIQGAITTWVGFEVTNRP